MPIAIAPTATMIGRNLRSPVLDAIIGSTPYRVTGPVSPEPEARLPAASIQLSHSLRSASKPEQASKRCRKKTRRIRA
jgi:hypothetical protein